MTISPLVYRVYEDDHLGGDGYPLQWHAFIKHDVRRRAENRCQRCGHPYVVGRKYPTVIRDALLDPGEKIQLSPCDARCVHTGTAWIPDLPFDPERPLEYDGPWQEVVIVQGDEIAAMVLDGTPVQAGYRILTVHHLNENKADCRWWNLAALCQRCHLHIQRKVQMERLYPYEHSEWFKLHAAGYYASVYLGEELSIDATKERLEELLGLERMV